MAGDFISDDDMAKLEAQHASAPDFISDDDMAKMDPAPVQPQDQRSAYDSMPWEVQATDPNAIGAAAGQVGRSIPVLGPAVVNAGHGLAALLTKITPDGVLPENLRNKTVGELYHYYKGMDDAQQAQLQQQYPKAAAVGSLGGAAMTPIPGAGMGGVAGFAAREGGLAAMNAADTAEKGGSLGDIAMSGALGAGGGALGEMAGPAVGKMLRNGAQDVAYESTGAMKADLREALERSGGDLNQLDATKKQVGQEMLNQGVISPFSGREATANRIQQALGDTGEKIGALTEQTDSHPAVKELMDTLNQERGALQNELAQNPDLPEDYRNQSLDLLDSLDQIQSTFSFDRRQAAQSLRNVATKYADLPDYAAARANLFSQADQLDSMPRFASLQEGNRLKSTYGKATGNLSEDNFTKDLRSQAYDALRGQVEQTLANRSGLAGTGGDLDIPGFQQASQDSLNKLRGLNQTFSNLKLAEQPSVNRDLSRQANLGIGLRGSLFAGVGGTLGAASGLPGGAVVGAAAGVGLDKVLRDVGPQTLAWGLDKAATASSKYGPILQAAAQRGPQAVAVTHYLLSQQDPGYQNHLQSQSSASGSFPRQVRNTRTGATATVTNAAETAEAMSEGFE